MTHSHILIATPCYGSQCFAEYTKSLVETVRYFDNKNISLDISFILSESLITRARNNLVAKFMADGRFTHLMFIDADISWNPEDIYKMLMHDKDIIGGLYPKKSFFFSRLNDEDVNNVIQELRKKKASEEEYNILKPHLLNYVLDAKNRGEVVNVDSGLHEVKYIGTGFMLIKKHVIEKMFEQYKRTKYITPQLTQKENEHSYALFDCEVRDGTYLSEDFLFCQRWMDMGGSIFAYLPANLVHTGICRYEGNVLDRLMC